MLVPIIMGSLSDRAIGEAVVQALNTYGVASELRVASAHKAPHFLFDLLEVYQNDPRTKVYITIAGRSNALSALVDAHVEAPVIACPPVSSTYGGADIFSSLRMPSGVTPVVVIDPKGAALAAVKMLALAHPELRPKLAEHRASMEASVRAGDAQLRQEERC